MKTLSYLLALSTLGGCGRLGFDLFGDAETPSDSGPDGGDAPARRYPRLATISTSISQEYWEEDFRIRAARLNVVIMSYWPEWQETRPMTMAQVMEDVKSRSRVGTLMFVYVNTIDRITDPIAMTNGDYPLWEKASTENWWVYELGTNGTKVYPSGDSTRAYVNISTMVTPDVNGEYWGDFSARHSYRIAVTGGTQGNAVFDANPHINGVFLGNLPGGASATAADWNRDGVTDTQGDAAIRTAVRVGTKRTVDRWRSLWPDGIIIAGKFPAWGPPYNDLDQVLDGGADRHMIGETYSAEDQSGTTAMLNSYFNDINSVVGPKLTLFQQTWDGSFQAMRYGLAACLMNDGYYDISDGVHSYVNHGLWFDEFDFDLGAPLAAPSFAVWTQGTYRRDFENGIVLMNPKGNGAQTVDLGGTFHKLQGVQDPGVNDGAIVTSVTLPDRDGMILRRM